MPAFDRGFAARGAIDAAVALSKTSGAGIVKVAGH